MSGRTQVGTSDIQDGSIRRSDLDVVTSTQSVIARAVGSPNVVISSTGADTGTGDVTFNLSTTGVSAVTACKYTVDLYGRITSTANLSASDIPSGSTYYIQNQTTVDQSASFRLSGSGTLGNGLILTSAVPGVTTSTLYNDTTSLMWSGTQVIVSAGSQTISGAKTFTTNVTAVSVSGLDYIAFNTAVTPPTETQGLMYWNSADRCPEVYLGNGVNGSVFQELHFYARNTTGTTLTNGEVCYISGAQGDRAVVSRAIATSTETAEFVIGLATEDIAINAFGLFTRFGIVRGIPIPNRNLLANDTVVLGTVAGQFVRLQDAPAKPYSQIGLGYVLRTTGAGAGLNADVFVGPIIFPRLARSGDVNITSIADGDILRWNATAGYWYNTTMPASTYNLPVASATVLGGIKIGTSLSINVDVLDINLTSVMDLSSAQTASGVKTFSGNANAFTNTTDVTVGTFTTGSLYASGGLSVAKTLQAKQIVRTTQTIAVNTAIAMNLASGENVIIGASGIPGALTGTTTITFSNTKVGSISTFFFKQGTTSFAVIFTRSGYMFYQNGKTAGVSSGSAVLLAEDMTLNCYYRCDITWLSSTTANVSLSKN